MFKIYDGRSNFYQWDLNRKLIVEDKSVQQVHFCNRTGNCSLVRYPYEVNGVYLVDVPNVILQRDWRITVYGYDKDYTRYSAQFDVQNRTKPENYIYTDDEIHYWEEIDERIRQLETEGIAKAVEEYLVANPVETGATEEQAAQIEQNAENISKLQESINGLATEEYVNNALAAIVNGDEVAY